MTIHDTAPQIAHSRVGDVAHLTIGTGHRHNALDVDGWIALGETADVLARDEHLAAVVVQGGGESFCAGYDIRRWVDSDPRSVDASFAVMESAIAAIERIPVPVVAAMRGVAAGAGCQLALACDIRLMSESAAIGMPILRLGILTPPAFADRLVRHAGFERAATMLFTGRMSTADEALRHGLVSEVCAAPELPRRLADTVDTIVGQSRPATRAAKAALVTGLQPGPRRGKSGPAVDWPHFHDAVQRFRNRNNTTRSGSERTTSHE